ncbi:MULTISPECIES: pyridoxal 5'-phosphate synthase glutaminase subunit PdxT [Lysinibacillus]|uniref:Pyridoxal 5'-phosphate synthase subunit PdxT n=1 Tax=Lysinibacillus fusiformis TaxID=28031 RepID=A0A1E4QZQ2_9BACI|nr:MULTISPECIES: pyridoxal 5'-phosphate synthase glutaminase subunit PdxT [Lysinibacillus]MBD8523584.1 pyridoxal 5'-phosphate synthase glutaminase subunit PdxT [Lysinibacillus fusiformis]MCR8855685.1 pyridoxal 5'-phosphate synthase glutaminase subunit PdxT [Lysinibacillus fusiformis]MED4890145.1 pyridoxal 5'-phosphate synthase glutaminase subunit PdxT [Lysinibacillus fusiformis]ODV53686.1 glutamine amidotransferase subunit PdxT [Lysinibacillus fusiformis]
MKRIGVLALQGAVREHVQMLENLGCEALEVKQKRDLIKLDGLVLPGGESTTMRKLLDRFELLEPIRELAQRGLPMFGTCAGLILMANTLVNDEPHLAVMDVTVARNSFGRQVDSFEVKLDIPKIGKSIPAVFIRAPHMETVGKDVEILAEHEGKIILARDRHLLGCSFHPELTSDTRILEFFIASMV